MELHAEYKHIREPSQHHLEEREAIQLSSTQIVEHEQINACCLVVSSCYVLEWFVMQQQKTVII